jgi:hypothetical protein
MHDEDREHLLLLVDLCIALCFSGLVISFIKLIGGLFFD